MFGHDKAIAGLKTLTKSRVYTIDPTAHVAHLNGESDRSFIILSGSMLDDLLLTALEDKITGLNSDEKSRFFHFEGPAGTFSSRIKLSQGLGIIDRKQAKQLDLIRELRNAAAHGHAPVTFTTKEVRCAVCSLFKSNHAKEIYEWDDHDVRFVFGLFCNLLSTLFSGAIIESVPDAAVAITKLLSQGGTIEEAQMLRASLQKRPAQLPPDHPLMGKTDTPPAPPPKPSRG